LEFYAATEGNVSLFNVEGKPGAVGRIPSYLAHRFPSALVRFDIETGEPIRSAEGLCMRCAPNEAGEAIGRIFESSSGPTPGNRFEGYAGESGRTATEQKILRDVFEPGDAWFRTGDLMRQDEQGYFYFVDRIGDTFRWKGENVSTSEVAEAIGAFPGILQANVYGVSVPHTDGRAGMAALVTKAHFDWKAFRTYLCQQLPAYAQPLFLRVRQEMEFTATFKFTKNAFVNEGFNPAVVHDALYFHDKEQCAYTPLEAELYQRIQSGQVRL
jgi:fatty-acyl-CoA synthase